MHNGEKKLIKNFLFALNTYQFVRYLFDDSANHNLVLHTFYYFRFLLPYSKST
jgi:hypothetical protein